MSDGTVIAGGGLAAQRAAETLRRAGYGGPVRMIAAEPHLPYDRPPLSKEVLSGEQEDGSVTFRAAEWYREHEVDLHLGVAASSLLPIERTLTLSDGSTLCYHRLLIATGSRPRRLPALEGYENVHELRTLDDTRGLREALGPGTRLAVIGAGFIGMEVAATARRLGAEVALIEAAPTPLESVLGRKLGEWFAELHRAEGVRLLTHRTVAGVVANGRITALRLSDGTAVEADEVLVGIGVRPDTEWLAGTPLDSEGVHVDEHGRTAVPDVFAAGDVASTYHPAAGRHIPGSHWEAADRQATRAARAMLDLDPGKVELASFWSDQYGIRIQYLGHAPLADKVTINGDLTQRNFTATYTREGQIVGALLVDRPRSLPAIRDQITQGAKPR
jgi:3-phenylpropionate/trans-cinnamate dioxygenase ferredoxin reductase subunit